MATTTGGKVYLGVDVGGTKIQAVVAHASGRVLERRRVPTPKEGMAEDTAGVILDVMKKALKKSGAPADRLAAAGLAVPGVVDAAAGRVVVTPNMNLTGLEIVPLLRDALGVPVALGNDVNCGTLGEKWLGSARAASSVFGIFVGTGVGGGLVIGDRLVTGCRGAAGEIGHMQIRKGGPVCGCGNRGCLEAFASRTAIERTIRDAVAEGKRTSLTDELGPDLAQIKSGALRRALEADDVLVRKVLRDAARLLGVACLNIRHLVDPEVIVLGGGVIEACDFYMMPYMEEVVEADPLPGTGPGGRLLVASLGDDAVALGAVALAQQAVGRRPFEGPDAKTEAEPAVALDEGGGVTIGGKTRTEDVIVRANGKTKRRAKVLKKAGEDDPTRITRGELQKACKGGPHLVVVGLGEGTDATLTSGAETYLARRGIAVHIAPLAEAVRAFEEAGGPRAAILRIGKDAG